MQCRAGGAAATVLLSGGHPGAVITGALFAGVCKPSRNLKQQYNF